MGHPSAPLILTIEIADGDSLLAAIVSRASEILVIRLGTRATQQIDEAVDRAITDRCGARIGEAVDAILEEGLHVRDQYGAPTGEMLSLAEIVRRYLTAQTEGRQTRLERMIRRAVDDALAGPLGRTIQEAQERVKALADSEIATRLARAMRDGRANG